MIDPATRGKPVLEKASAIFVSKVEEVNWLLNTRAIGSNDYEPLLNAYALVTRGPGEKFSIHVFVDSEDVKS